MHFLHFTRCSFILPGMHVEIDIPQFNRIQFLNLHLRPPLSPKSNWGHLIHFFQSKQERLDDLRHWMEKISPEKIPTIALGDTNEAGSGIWYGRCTNYLSSLGMRDAVDEHDGQTDTWIWPLPLFNLRFVLPFFLLAYLAHHFIFSYLLFFFLLLALSSSFLPFCELTRKRCRGRYDHIYYDTTRLHSPTAHVVLETFSDHRAVVAKLTHKPTSK